MRALLKSWMGAGRNVKLISVGLITVGLILGTGYGSRHRLLEIIFHPTNSNIASSVFQLNDADVTVVAKNLDTPWSMVELPNGDLLITELSGLVRRIGQNGTVLTIADVHETAEGGLLGLALHPRLTDTHFIYLYYTRNEADKLTNQVIRYKMQQNQLSDKTVLLNNIPASANHDGGYLAFGPDDKLYITTGDAGKAELAQDKTSLAGKILRLNDDGSIPSDNPYGNTVWSYGHRNPQGLTWDEQGRMWATEHGPSGVDSGRDELNLILKGGNYGWPIITGSESKEGMHAPIAHSGDTETWAPAGIIYAQNSLFFTGLRGQSLYQAKIISSSKIELVRHLDQQYGRLRAITLQGDQMIIGTSNHDGRGKPNPNDDQLIKFPASLFSR